MCKPKVFTINIQVKTCLPYKKNRSFGVRATIEQPSFLSFKELTFLTPYHMDEPKLGMPLWMS